MQDHDWQKIAPDVARQILGEPIVQKSDEWRWGSKGSLVFNLETGQFYDFEEGVGGGVKWLVEHHGKNLSDILKQFGYDLTLQTPKSSTVNGNTPITSNVRSFSREQMVDLYRQSEIKVKYANNFMVLRNANLPMKYAPFSLNPNGTWSMKRPEGLLPLYITNNYPDKPVIVNEGEKAMRGAERIYDYDVCCWHGGATGWNKTDWSAIYGRDVYIWADNDEAGIKCAYEIAGELKKNGCKVKVIQPPETFKDKDDLWDAAERGDFRDSKELEDYIVSVKVERPKGALYVQTADEIMESMTKPDWLVEKCIERATVTSLFGAPKSGKSFIAIAMACSIATGKDFYGFDTKKSAVLYLAGEGHTAVARRIKSYEQFYSRSLEKAPLLISNRGSRIGDDVEFAMLQEVCRDIEREHGKLGMIIVDTLARNYGLNENSTEDMNKFIQRIDELKEEFQASMVIVHHTGHSSGGRARGSSVLPAAIDYEFRVERDKNSDEKAMLVTLKQTLVKDGTPIDDLYFQFKELTLLGYDGTTSGVLALTDESPRKIGLTRAREQTIDAIAKIQKEKLPNDPSSYWVKHTIIENEMELNPSTLKSRLKDLKDNELVYYKEGYGYQAKSFDNEVF
ncbi:MAG: hypothetical protein CMA63_02730 [Euryarchaeota archaeon]|nr:hypothetical protein [Euryarchaeota archaeon]|tara:strand:+ start:5605 stop:7470 length:1866 start_codon:yes stop_codon:yes gene_type:complete